MSLATDRTLLTELLDRGVQERQCPICHALCRLAEPVGLHDPDGGRFALYVPEALSHRRIALLALTLEHIASLDPATTPEYCETPTLLCGRAELRRWLGGSSHPRSLRFGSQLEDLSGRIGPSAVHSAPGTPGNKSEAEQHSHGAPEIHAAFADLVSDGSAPPQASSETLDSAVGEPADRETDGEDDWLSDEFLDGRLEFDSKLDNSSSTGDLNILDLDAVDDMDLITESGDAEPHSDRPEDQSESAVQTPGPTGIEDSSICLEQGRILMTYRVDATVLSKFASGRVELWFQLFELNVFPLVTLTLVNDGRASEPETLTWLLDLTRQEQRAIAVSLQRRYQARVQLFISSRFEPLVLDLGGHRESNVSVVLDRAAAMLADHPPDDRPFDRAAERLARMRKPHGVEAVPVEFHEARPAQSFEEAMRFVGLLAQWFEDEKYNYLIFVRSFPLDTFEELIRRGLEEAVAYGASIPEPLVARAMTLGLAGSRKELTAKLVGRFSNLVRDDAEIPDNAAVDNWTNLLRRAHADKVSISAETIDGIQQQVARAGRTNDARLQEALAKVKAGS